MICRACGGEKTRHYQRWLDDEANRVAIRCGFNSSLCRRCAGSIKRLASRMRLELNEATGTLWLAARTKTVANDIVHPGRRERESAYKRSRLSEARDRLFELESELGCYVRSPEELAEWDNDDIDELMADRSWEPFHNELLELCRRWGLASIYRDEDWEPL